MRYLLSDTFKHQNLDAFQIAAMRAVERFLKFVGRLPNAFSLDPSQCSEFDCRVLQPDTVSCGFILVWKFLNVARSGDLKQVRNAFILCLFGHTCFINNLTYS